MEDNKLIPIIGFKTADGNGLCFQCYAKGLAKPVEAILFGSKGGPCAFCKHKVNNIYKQVVNSYLYAEQKALKLGASHYFYDTDKEENYPSKFALNNKTW